MKVIANTPVSIMRVPVSDGTVTREKDVKASALPMSRALQWMDEAETIGKALLSAATPDERAEAMSSILDVVCGYSDGFPVDAIRENASAVQVVSAFEMLKEINDPLAVARAKQEAEQEKSLAMLSKLPQSVMEGLIQKHISEASQGLPSISE